VIGSGEFVIEVDSKIAGNFCLGKHVIIEGHWGGGGSGRVFSILSVFELTDDRVHRDQL